MAAERERALMARARDDDDAFIELYSFYVPRIYGLEEVGGTSVLMMSSIPFPSLGFRPDLPLQPLPQFTWRVLSRIPDLAVVVGALLYGIWWITNRRTMVQEALAKEAASREQDPH